MKPSLTLSARGGRWLSRLAWSGLLSGVWSLAQAGIPIEHWTQDQGVRVYLARTDALPMLDVQVDVDGGSRRDPAAQAGLASVTALMLGKGVAAAPGQPAMDENALTEAWADLGAQFQVGASKDRFSVQLRTLSDPEQRLSAVALAARILAAPTFPAQVWQRERARLDAAWHEAQTRPDTHADRLFAQAVYGAHPYGQSVSPDTLAAIQPSDLRQFYRRHAQTCTARVSLVGQIDRPAAESLVRQLLAGWQSHGCSPLPELPPVPATEAARSLTHPFAAAQAQIVVGQRGVMRSDPDFLPLLLGNHILGGGGFSSRLMQVLREERGLTYGVGSAFEPGRHAGAFSASLQTRPDQAGQALVLLRQELERYTREGPTPEEVERAKASLINGFALRLDSNRKWLEQLASMAWNDMPLDYLDQWTQRMAALERTDVVRAWQRVIHSDHWISVVVGGQP